MGDLGNNKNRYDNTTIFDLIGSDDNEIFTYLSRSDKQFLLQYISKYFLDYRSSLGLDHDDSFGIELEFDDADKGRINRRLNNSGLIRDWHIKADASLHHGGEIASPILHDNGEIWDAVEKVCTATRENAIISNNCGGHVHVGRQALGDDRQAWLNFMRLWSAYENVIFRFGYGEYSTGREGVVKFAKAISSKLYVISTYASKYNCSIDEIVRKLNSDRFFAVNFTNIKTPENPDAIDTFEFRAPNGTLSETIWQNNVNLFVKMLNVAKSPDFCESVVMNRLEITKQNKLKITEYDQLDMDTAIEFADVVFDNNLDKVYFIRQYMKAMENGAEPLQETRPFTRVRKS